MIKETLYKTLVVFLCQALAFMPVIYAAQISLPSGDLVAPVITQPEYIDQVRPGQDHTVTVQVTDNTGVKLVVLYYRVIGTENYHRITMQKIANTDNYQAVIDAKKIKKPGIEYYIQAMDLAGNTLLHGYSFSPLSVKIAGEATRIAESSEPVQTSAAEDDSIFSNKWFWIGIGVLALGAAAGGGGGSSSTGPSGASDTAVLTITAVEPTN